MKDTDTRTTHLFVPPSARRFAPKRFVAGPGMRHAALEYDLVEAIRPTLVVDLGAGDCSSFFVFCQSIVEHDVDGCCYAIDHWPEPAEDDAFKAVEGFGRASYAGTSYFVRMAPAQATRHFDDETIDLLRVDGTRTDVVGSECVEDWFRRVRPGGVIVWHGAFMEPARWSWVAARCSSVVFSEGRGGIGLARKGGGLLPAGELVRLLFMEGEGAELERLYKHVHEHLEFARLLAVGLEAT